MDKNIRRLSKYFDKYYLAPFAKAVFDWFKEAQKGEQNQIIRSNSELVAVAKNIYFLGYEKGKKDKRTANKKETGQDS